MRRRPDSLDRLVPLVEDHVFPVHPAVAGVELAFECPQYLLLLLLLAIAIGSGPFPRTKVSEPASEIPNTGPDEVTIIAEDVGAWLLGSVVLVIIIKTWVGRDEDVTRLDGPGGGGDGDIQFWRGQVGATL